MSKSTHSSTSPNLETIAALDSDIMAWVYLDADLVEAQQCGLEERPLPLSGFTVGVKDMIDVRGMPTRAGSKILANAPAAMEDAPSVAQLRESGALILGKTATTEFAYYDPALTRNPRNLAHTPGGSSSGSAAAVAAGMCDAALGTQTFGSVIRPAAFCGVFALKPSYGAISRQGVLPLAASYDHIGLFTRSVAVAARFAEALFEPWFPDERPGTVAIESTGSRRTRLGSPIIGIPDRYFTQSLDDTVRQGYRAGIDALESAGFPTRPIQLPPLFEAAVAASATILRVEAASAHRRWFPERRLEYGLKLRDVLDDGGHVSGVDYFEAQCLQNQARRQMLSLFEQVDFLATPSAPILAPEGLSWTGDPALNTPFSVFGLPVINLPASYAPNGLSAGFQIAGRPWSETRLLRLALTLEDSGFGQFVSPVVEKFISPFRQEECAYGK